MSLDVIIRNGTILDGSGKRGFKADVSISRGRIERIGDLSGERAERVIEATRLVVSPGFINMHSHADITILVHRHAYSSVCQGITTEVTGQCGYSLAPFNEKNREYYMNFVAQWAYIDRDQIEVDWSSFAELLAKYENNGIGLNLAPLVGHGTVRSFVLGIEGEGGEKGWVTRDELAEMKTETEKAMKAGAFGLGTGLMYPPQRNALTEEVVELCRVAASYGGIYCSHMREEGARVVEAVREHIEISRRTGIPANIAHHKAMNRENWGKIKENLKLIDEARAEGLPITHDVYPYTFSGGGNLGQTFLPSGEQLAPEKIVERLKDSETFEEMKKVAVEQNQKSSYPREFGAIAYSKNSPELIGKSLAEIAKMKGTDWITAAKELYIADEGQTVTAGIMSEEDLRLVLKHPVSMVCTDAWVFDQSFDYRKPTHPRDHGTYPRLLGKYVREEGVLTLEEAIRKITGLPAQTLKLTDRGIIKEGAAADITIFNPETVIDRSTFADPVQYPDGIEYVFVNGTLAVDGGQSTGSLSGRVLKLNA